MGKIHKNFFATAFCAAFLFLMSFGAFGQTISIESVTEVNQNEVLIGGTTTDIADYTTLVAYYGTESDQSTLMMGNTGVVNGGSFQINVTGLQSNTTYYFQVRDDAAGTLSNIYEFQTSGSGNTTYTVTTMQTAEVSSTDATLIGTVTPYSSATIDKVGFIYSSDPTMLEMMVQQITIENTMSGDFIEGYVVDADAGEFRAQLNYLMPDADYYYQACVRSQENGEHWIVANSYESLHTEGGTSTGGNVSWVTIGSDDSFIGELPVNGEYNYSLSQQIYTNAEIDRTGTITKIALYNGNPQMTRTINLYMVSTYKQNFSGLDDWESVSSSNLVFSGEVTFLVSQWTEIELNTPFEYDGTGNIIVVVDDNTGNYESAMNFSAFEATGQSIYVYSDYTDYDATDLSAVTASSIGSVKNQIKFGFMDSSSQTSGDSVNWITIGAGNTTNQNLPVNSYYDYSFSQQIYTYAEIGRAGTIESVAFYNTSYETTRTIDLYMYNTDRQTFTSTNDWEFVDPGDLVFSGEVTFLSDEWTEIPLNTPFYYDGLHNIIIVADDNTVIEATSLSFRVFSATAQAIYYSDYSTDIDPTYLNGTTALDVANVKSQIKFGFTATNPTFSYVDLGLTSGTLWATMNVGAERPEDFGTYFAWGETTTKTIYDWASYTYAAGEADDAPGFTKYCNDASLGNSGFTDELTVLQASDDAATANLGSNWRMPTYDEILELTSECQYSYTTQNGVYGIIVTGPNSNTIFIPAAGGRQFENEVWEEGSGSYWASSLDTNSPTDAQGFYFESNGFGPISIMRRYGLPIRPVYVPSNTANNQNENVIFQCDFEDTEQNSLWSLNNSSQTNYWHIGSAVSNGGSNALYITNDGGGSHQYDNTATSYSYATIQVWIGEADNYQFDFDWMANGEYNYDNMRAFLVSLDAVSSFVDGSTYGMEGDNNTTPAGWIDLYSESGIMEGQTSWQHNSKTVALEEGGYNLVFFWKNNDGGGFDPPAAVDNIVVSRETQTANNQTGTFTDDRDGRTYATVTIGDQIWMAENLRYSYNMTVATEGETSEAEPYIYYPNGQSTNVETYGYLYNWTAAMNGANSSSSNPSGVQGICPEGWHMPSKAEWTQLSDALGGETNAGAMLAGNLDVWNLSYGTITQSEYFGTSGFNALPAGMYSTSFENFERGAWFWTATETSSTSSHNYYLYGNSNALWSNPASKAQAYSVRCVKNDENTVSSTHEYVNLGLPSGTLWATTNIGADHPSDYGNYYSWGSVTSPASYESYDWSEYSLCDGSSTTINKYCTNGDYGTVDNRTTLLSGDDAAVASWGENWKMPTSDEFQELITYCTWEWSVQDGKEGYLVSGNGNSIFLPAAGYFDASGEHSIGVDGNYWTKSLNEDVPIYAMSVLFYSGNKEMFSQHERPEGLTIRPVYASQHANNLVGSFTDDRDGRTYDYIIIGEQTWMSENLRYDNSGSMPIALSNETSETDAYLYYPNGDSGNVETYGYLYNWPAAMNGANSSSSNPSGVQGICPNGWHLPSNAEWTQLSDYLGGTENAGAMLAGNVDVWNLSYGTITQSPYFGTSGFNALPAGMYSTSFENFERGAWFWTATETSSTASHNYYLYGNSNALWSNPASKAQAYSVRCVKDAENTASTTLDPTAIHNDHGYVDLGLSVKWATTNIGATIPEDYGSYYAWAETEPKATYDWMTYQYCLEDAELLTRYCNNASYGADGYTDEYTTLLPGDDVATAQWGAGWRMPTKTEMEELVNGCTWEWTTQNGINGYIVRNESTGYAMFLPAAGTYDDNRLTESATGGYYWSSSLSETLPSRAWRLRFYESSYNDVYSNDRIYGNSVRAVYDATLATPTVSTDSVSNIATTSAYIYGTLINEDGVPEATEFGFKYGTDSQSLTETIQGENGTVGFIATLTGLSEGTIYYYRAYATNINGTGYGEIQSFTTPSGAYGGHYYIDLGLSSGTLWATCNVGADRPEGYGNYYAWGETTPKDEYTWSTYQHANGSESTLTKYCNEEEYGYNGFVDNLTTLDLEDDAAAANWGTGWRMPAKDEMDELYNSCTSEFTTQNGVNGVKFTAPNGNTVFFPISGVKVDNSVRGEGEDALYWSNMHVYSDQNLAYCYSLNHIGGDVIYSNNMPRYVGYSVRAIFQKSPVVVTKPVTDQNTVTITLQGKVASSGISDVNARGFIYGTDSENLTDSIASTDNTDEFTALLEISNLLQGRRYYYRAFAANDDGVSYGEILSFRTVGPPEIKMYHPEWRDTTSVSLKAYIEHDGEINSNKFYIGVNKDNLTEVSGEVIYNDTDNTISVNAYDLLPATLYWAVAESGDEYGSSKGDTISFYTYGHFKDVRDNTDYKTIKIGDQTWMAENLRYAGDLSIGNDTSSTVAYRYYPNGDESNAETYGYLYNWKAAMNGENSSDANPSGVQGICPDGWHLPSNAEWTQLETALGSTKTAAKLAGSASSWFCNNGDCSMLSDKSFGYSGFNAVPSGVYYQNYYVFGQEVAFWSTTQFNETNIYTRYLYTTRTEIVTSDNETVNGYNVRCLKNIDVTVATNSATNVTPASAILHGSILNAGNSEITARGFMFGTESTSLTQNLQSTDNTADFTYTLSDLTANTTYYFKAYATIEGETKYGEVQFFRTPTGQHGEYYYVDLGLPSGTMWATTNVGASNPEDYGNYYAWGETTPKAEYTEDNYTYSDNPTTLPSEADAVAVNWGGEWITPTVDDLEELKNNCTSEWTSINGVYGRVFTAQNGNSIFMPAAGRFTSTLGSAGTYGDYWSSSLYTDNTVNASYIYFNSTYTNATVSNSVRYYGYTVRGIYRTVPTVATLSATDVSATSAVLHGRISSTGNSEITARGFNFGTSSDNLTETLTSTDNTDEFSYTVSDLEAGRTYYFRAFATNSDGTSYGEIKNFVIPSGQNAGHDYIDLGLPSGIMWATCNVGATSPEGEGNKYAWGETMSKDTYTQDNYTYSDNPERLPADNDVAAVVWGGGWHTPTSADFEELVNNCTSEYTTLNDVNGYVFTGPNGNSIFIPRNYYWSSSIDVSTQTSAYALSLNGTSPSVRSSNRYYGDYIRGVYSVPEVTLSYPVWRDSVAVSLKAKYAVNGTVQSSKYYVGTAKNNLSEVTEGVTLNGDEHLLTVNVYNLSPRTEYWAMAEIVDEYGTYRSDTLSFYTYGSFVDSRNNATYYTIQIGEQTWMAQNLKYAGDEVSLGTTSSETEPYYYYVNGDEANTDTYGYLYNLAAALNGANSSDANPSGVQGICPNGWHLPSDAEWTQLATTLGGTTNAGAMLAGNVDLWEAGTLTESEYFGASGFNALPAGSYTGYYDSFGSAANFWSTTEALGDAHSPAIRDTNLYIDGSVKFTGYSVRCVKGTTIYAHDTVNYCGEQYTFGTQTLTADGDYEETFHLATDKDSVVYLHLTMNPAPTASISASTIHCSGEAATLTNTASGGTAPYTYNWTADAGITLGETSVTTTETSYNNTATPTFSECSASFSVSLSVTDANGCTANATPVTINVEREDFSLPADGSTIVSCASEITAPTLPTVTDNCGNVLTGTLKSGYPTEIPSCEGDVVYKYTFTDCEGNSHDWTYTYTVELEDFTMPADGNSTVACASEITAPTLPTVTDNCGNALTGILKSGYPTATPSCEGDVVYKYTFTDCEGNSHDWTYTYTIEHSNAPSEEGDPVSTTGSVECLSAATAPTTLPVVKDVCGNTLTAPTPIEGGTFDGCSGTKTYTYIYEDCSGLQYVWVYTYTITNSTAPALTGTWPSDITGQNNCYADRDISGLLSDDGAKALYTANCGTISVSHSDVEVSTDNCGWTVTRTYTITDGCNQTTNTQSVSGSDQSAPTLTGTWPANIEGQDNCFADADISGLMDDDGVAELYSDGCGGTVTVSHSDANTLTDNCGWTITRTYTITNACGTGSTTNTQSVSGSDETAPTIGDDNLNRQLTSTNCTFIVPDLTSEVRNIASDNCTANGNLTIVQSITAGTEITTATSVVVTVTDQCGNNSTKEIELTLPTALTTSLSADPATIACNGGTTSITNTPSGGTTPYQYFWSNSTNEQSLASVLAGTYTVTVRDNNGCSVVESLEITQPGALTALLSATEISCHGVTSTITSTVNGGTTPYAYAWETGETSQDLENVSGGTYSVTVTDANNCIATATITIDEPAELTSSLTAGTIGCNGGTANITNTVTGGTEPITYEWSNGANTQSLTGVVAGEYTVTVRDNNGCSVVQSATLSQPDALTASLSAGSVGCNGGTTDITSTVEGGTPNYTYAWSNDSTTNNITGVGAGTYSVTVSDANSCTASAITTVSEPDVLTVSISGSTSVCENTTSTLTANVQGGTPDFTYLWNDGTATSSITTPQLTVATEYSVTVTDANNCTASASVNVEIGDTPGITIADVTPICVGGNTMLQANVSNAGTGYTVEWSSTDTGAGLPADITTETITVAPTSAGTYTYTVSLTATSCSDGQPFTSSDNVQLLVNGLPDAAITNNTNETTITCSTTQISLTATGGTAYQWSNGGAIADNNITSAGTYIVTVTDANGCSNTESIVITEDVAAPTVNIINETGTTLLTCTTTTINVEATGTGTSYLWSNEVTTATNAITTGGTYTVTATADNGCTSTAAIEITPNADAPTVSITNNSDTTVLTCSLTSINVTATGSGTSYQWSNGANTAENTLTAPGTYTVTATAGNGCSASEQITITQDIAAPEIIASATDSTICQGASTTISATGGNSYTWSPETGLPTTVGATLTATPTATTTYTVTGIGANGCTGSGEVVITVNLPTSSEIIQTACESFEWNGTTYTETGDFTQTFTNANGCDSVVTLHLTINNSVTNEISDSACESYEWYGQTYTETGDYEYTLTAVNGCDSVVTLHLTINQPTESNDTVTTCGSYEWFGQTYTETGDYVHTLQSVNGCDSVVTLHLTINQPTEGNDTVIACDNYEWFGQTYTETGDYVHTLQSVNGCDSIVNLHLTINSSTAGEFADQMCSGVPYEYNGQTYTEAGTYHVTLVNANGCDSVVTLTLTYSNSCGGIISGVITDAGTDEAIPNAKLTIGNQVTRTNDNGEYSLEVVRGLKTLRVSAEGYASHYEAIDIQSDTVVNIAIYKPEISMDVDSISVTTYPYLAQYDSITITNTGNTALVWSSVSEYDSLALLPYDEEAHQRRNSRSLWDSIQTFTTQFNAEQAIATDGFFIYTSSWQRPGEFNRYTPDGEYIETFYIENVGMIRNLSFDGTYFYGTEATNIIFKLDLDNQTLVDSITTDISNIRHCSFDRQNGNLLAGDWNSLYSIDTATGVSTQIRNDLMNVYSSAYDNLSSGGPYLWLFSQASQNNGPSAYIRQFSIGDADYTEKTHYLDDLGLGNASLAGGICASEYVCEGKFVLLADIQNPSGNNIIATYEIGRTNNIVSPEKKSGRIMPNESLSIGVREHAVGVGEYEAKIRYRAAVMGNSTKDVNVTVTAIAPECDAVQQITAVTDTFYNVTLNWQPIELGEYNSVSYLIFGDNSPFAIDTTTETAITFERLSVGEHCFNVRALSVGDYSCLSESSDTVCAEIEPIPCNVALTVSASNDGESIFLTWNKPVGVEYFRIYRDDNAVEEVLYDGRYTDSNVLPEVTYCYTIFAYFEDGICNEIVGTACTKIVSGVCAESPVLQIEAVGYSVHLNWTVSSESYAYKIFRNDVYIGLTTDTTYFDNVNPGYNYCYRVESLCDYGMFAYSNEECVFVEIIPEDDDENGQGSGEGDAIAEWTADNLTVYPNPTYGQFFIEGQRIATVIIYNASGQIVAELDNNESDRIMVDCDGWNPGLYNIRIISEEGQVATRKVSIFR